MGALRLYLSYSIPPRLPLPSCLPGRATSPLDFSSTCYLPAATAPKYFHLGYSSSCHHRPYACRYLRRHASIDYRILAESTAINEPR